MSDHVDLHYELRGSGEPLILIMGLGADGSVWERHVAAYERHFSCILVDNRGVGRSPQPPGPYTTEKMAGDVAALMDRLNIERAAVNGISMGGAIAQSLALLYPRKVSRLVLVSTWAVCDDYTRMVFEHFKQARAAVAPPDFMQLLQLWIWTARYVGTHSTELAEARAAAALNPPQSRQGFEAQCDACITHNALKTGLERIKVPTLITAGTHDIFTPMPFAEQLHRAIPQSVLSVFEGSGHAHHWEECERFNHETLQFLRQTS